MWDVNSVGYSYGGGQRWSGDPKERGGARRGRRRGEDSGSGSRLSGHGDDGDGSVMSGSGVGGDTDGRYSGLGSGGGSHGDGRLASRSGREHVQVSYCCIRSPLRVLESAL